MCADYRRAMMDVLEKREKRGTSEFEQGKEGEKVKAGRWKLCVAVGMESFSNSKHSYRPS